MAAFGGGFVERDGPHSAEIETVDGLADVELQDAPEPLVGDADDPSGRGDGPLAHQRQRGLFEQQGEAAVRTRPRYVDTQYAVVGAIGSGDAGGDKAGMLEEVEVTSGHLLPVVWLAQAAAGWAGKACTRFGGDSQMQFVGLFAGFQALVDDTPRWGQSKAEGEDIAVRHGGLRVNGRSREAGATDAPGACLVCPP